MVGAGVLIEPLLGFPHWVGVVLVGAIVITIVATAGMTSTTYVQFIKGSLLIVFALVIVIALAASAASPPLRTRGAGSPSTTTRPSRPRRRAAPSPPTTRPTRSSVSKT